MFTCVVRVGETYSELELVVGQRDVAPHDLVDLGRGVFGIQTRFVAQRGDGVGQALGAGLEISVARGRGRRRRMCRLHRHLLFNLHDLLDDRHLGRLNGRLDRLRAGHGAVGHEIERLLRVLLDNGRALELGRRGVHGGHRLGHDGRNDVLDEQLVLRQRLGLEGVPFGGRVDDLDELLGAPVLGECEREFARGRLVELDVLDPARALVHALVGQLAQIEIEAGLLESVDLGDGLREGLPELDGVGGALVDAEAVSVSHDSSIPSQHLPT